MRKKNKDLRVILIVNFMAEILGLVTLYLSNIHSIKVLNINILSCLFITMNIIGILLIFKFIKNKKTEKIMILTSLVLELLYIIFSFFTRNIVFYFQLISDILKFLVILNIYKDIKKSSKKTEKQRIKKHIFIMLISYGLSKIACIILNLSSGLTIRPIMTTISIIGIVIVYTLYIKQLEKGR